MPIRQRLTPPELLFFAGWRIFITRFFCYIFLSGVSESDLAGILDCNPSLVTEIAKPEATKELNLEIRGNDERPKSFINDADQKVSSDVKKEETEDSPLVNGTGEALSDLDFISSQSSQYEIILSMLFFFWEFSLVLSLVFIY